MWRFVQLFNMKDAPVFRIRDIYNLSQKYVTKKKLKEIDGDKEDYLPYTWYFFYQWVWL